MATMNALVYNNYGDIDQLHFEEVKVPEPNEGEVLIKVHASSINAGDLVLLKGEPAVIRLVFGIFSPRHKILGHDVSGTIAKLGNGVSEFKEGDAVYGPIPIFFNGSFAEYVSIPAKIISKKPESMSFEEAAAFPTAAVTALQSLRDYRPPPNTTLDTPSESMNKKEKVMIYGASGGVGAYAIQIAKHLGYEVTAVCSTRNLDQARQFGADNVIDYKTQSVFEGAEHQFDLIFAANGDNSVASYKSLLKKDGVFTTCGGSGKQSLQAVLHGLVLSRGKVNYHSFIPSREDLDIISELFESKKLDPNVDCVFPKDRIIEALRYSSDGKAKGKVVIKMIP
ncbi:hypothetical protein BB560_005079 [Smittium megazygosporum]|uniref:Enoyl reductase (ER) domain-containing protein n=1 Tax=Smittium megazygosporum TaxID=133381 RepID=A0A2T9Z7F9_9FUNG|nr:hypothetical protein BB560_005079 [Smittium megazygosporum]